MHGGVSKETHEAVVKMLRAKEADITDLRLRLSIAEDGGRRNGRPEVEATRNSGFRLHQGGLLDLGVDLSSLCDNAWQPANPTKGPDALAQLRLKQVCCHWLYNTIMA